MRRVAIALASPEAYTTILGLYGAYVGGNGLEHLAKPRTPMLSGSSLMGQLATAPTPGPQPIEEGPADA